MKEIKKRTLYECSHARVKETGIYCDRGYSLCQRPNNRHVDINRLARGKRLAFETCQDCLDFDCMGPPVPPEERGWLEEGIK